VQKTKVTSIEKEDLPSQNAQEKLAVFSSNLGILMIGVRKESSLSREAFSSETTHAALTKTGLEPSAVVELVNSYCRACQLLLTAAISSASPLWPKKKTVSGHRATRLPAPSRKYFGM
jgi:hypothetical protein